MTIDLRPGLTGIADSTDSTKQLKINADGSIDSKPASGSNQRVNAQSGDFVAGSIADLVTAVARLTSILAALDLPAQEDGNLATLAGVVSGGKAAVKAASSDFADGAIASIGAKADAAITDPTLSASEIALLKGLLSRLNVTSDYDTGGGTQALSMLGLALPASGGAVAGGTATNPLRTDPTGTTTQPTGGNVAAGATDSGNPLKVGGKYNASLPTLTDGQRGDAQLDSKSIELVNLAYALSQSIDSILSYPYGHSKTNITTADTTMCKSGAGTLKGIYVNTPAASATITVYDNTAGSGTKIGTITFPGVLLNNGPMPATMVDIAFGTGLTIVTTGTSDITVAWR